MLGRARPNRSAPSLGFSPRRKLFSVDTFTEVLQICRFDGAYRYLKGSRSAAQHPTLLTEVILESINWKNRFTGTLRFFHLKKLDLPDRNPSDRSNIFIDIYGGKVQPVEIQNGILKNGQDGLILRSARLLWSL